MRVRTLAAVLSAVALIGVACEDELTLPQGVEVYTAALNGANERPTPVTTTATGTATFTVVDNLVSWRLEIVDPIDNATAAHIHKGVADSAGGVMVTLFSGDSGPDFSGVLELDSNEVADSVLTHMRNGRAYVNVHTPANPGGEIRGQTRRVQ